MKPSWIGRLRRLLRVGFDYLVGWRGPFIALAAGSSAAIVGLSTGSLANAIVALAVVGIPLAAVVMLLANQERRAMNREVQAAPVTGRQPAPASMPVTHESRIQTPAGDPSPAVRTPPLVAVVITTWNESRFIETTIESVRAQTLSSFECIIVDDASTDDTVDRIVTLVDGDARFRVFRTDTNQGPAAARNTGIAEVRAPYLTFLDGDDFLYPESLQKRIEGIAVHSDDPWVAGVYCQWRNVPEVATLGPVPKPAPKRPRVTWLNSLTNTPFILSAPLFRTEVVLSVGGMPTVDAAEDALFWNRILREGYVFDPVHEVGVAYRMKRTSNFRRTAVESANIIADQLAGNSYAAEDLTASGPFPYHDSCTAYMWELTRVRRGIGALASAIESNDRAAAELIAEQLSKAMNAYHLWELPIEKVITSHATRVTRHLGDAELHAYRDRVAAATSALLEPRVEELVAEVRARQASLSKPTALPAGDVARPIVLPRRVEIPPAFLDRDGSTVEGRVVLMPSAAYHVAETGPIAEELEKIGIESVVMVSDRRWPPLEAAQSAYSTPVLGSVAAGPWLTRAAAVVSMNDWGEEYREYVGTANELGVPTFAKVEGVQDFADDDVHWGRKAYQRARWILAQGPNDVRHLPDQDTIVVSNNRLERIWLGPPRAPGPPFAVINLNFTYGVLEDAREMWLNSVVEACSAVDIPYVISLHPAEKDRYSGAYPVANLPIRHLLTEASVLVSRFSTVPFEAMARGVPFVYHNPHGEKVPTFLSPEGAFDITASTPELERALRGSTAWGVGYRDRARAFFLAQVAVDPEVPAPRRAAEAIAARVDRS
jgi:teichuronic acid biosynthesis glycosyltransferase TuaG